MLRGAQTSAELRLHSERLYKFADISSVEGFLDELAARDPALVVRLARAPGEREARWAHLLCGEPPAAAAPAAMPPTHGEAPTVAAGEVAALKAEVTRLRAELEQLRDWARRVASDLGVTGP
jgi:hypothetical protein